MLMQPWNPALIKRRSSLHEPRMGANPNRISSPFALAKAAVSHPRLTKSAQVSGVAACKAPKPDTACRKTCWAINGPSRTQSRTGCRSAQTYPQQPLVTG